MRGALVGFNPTEPTRAMENQTLLEFNAAFSGYECGLPETYGFDHQQLAELEAFRRLHSKS